MAIKNLVFEGGGVKGIAYAGAIIELSDRGILKDVNQVAGASAGALTALPLCLGYEPQEVADIIKNTDFKGFSDDSFGFIRDAIRIFRHFGWHKGKKLKQWIAEIISAKEKPDITFKQHHERGIYRDLFVVVSDLSERKAKVFSYKTTPDMKIVDAVHMSASLPFYFQAVKLKGHVYADGGITWNYPIDIFDTNKVLNTESLGFRLGREKEKDYKSNQEKKANQIRNFKEYSTAVVGFLLEESNKSHIKTEDWERTAFLDTLGVGTTDFDISPASKNKLIKSGRHGVKDYFRWKEAHSDKK